ncbi:hypothetical protein CerSpe_071990 [Prunus speciosa]
MTRGGQRTTFEPSPGEPSLPSPSRVPGTFEGFEFSDSFFRGSGDRCRRSSFNQKVQSKMAIDGLISYQNFDSFIGSEDEREFNYEDDSEKGPARWGEIRQEWSLCNKGSVQSPINLLDDRVELKWEADAGFIRINGTLYQLKQCYWHSPSAHTVNDMSFDLEVHVVHQSPTGKIAVTGILYKI